MKCEQKLIWSTILCIMAIQFSIAQTPDWSGAFSTEGDEFQSLWDMQTDLEGNIIVCGEYRDGNFDIGGITIEPMGTLTNEGYVAKLDVNQTAVWAKAIGGAGLTGNVLTAVAPDSEGNTYLAGYFLSFAGLPLVVDDISIPIEGGFNQIYLLKLDQNGTALWAKHFNDPTGTTNTNRIINMEVDSNDDLVINGAFGQPMVFDDIVITSSGSNDSFIAKCDADGNFLWATTIGSFDQDQSGSLAINGDDEIFASGIWAGDTLRAEDLFLVNPIPASSDNYDRWIGKFTSSGEPIWIHREGGPENEWGSSLAINQSGGVMVLSRAITAVTINEVEYQDAAALVSEYNFEGGVEGATPLMECELPNASAVEERFPGQIVTDENGNFYVLQTFLSEECTVGGNIVLENNGGNNGTADFVVAKVDASGAISWAVSAGGTDSDSGNSLVLTTNGTVVAGGEFLSFELPIGETVLQNFGSPERSVFAAYLDITTGLSYAADVQTLSVYPNPANDFVSFEATQLQSGVVNVDVYDMQGRLVSQENTLLGPTNRVNVSHLENGVYFINFELNGQAHAAKFIVNR